MLFLSGYWVTVGRSILLEKVTLQKIIRITHSRKIARAVECGDRGCG